MGTVVASWPGADQAAAGGAVSSDVIDIFLGPGDLYFGDPGTRIRTVLGSCVAVTVWHPERRVGGMCHFMLPGRGRRGGGGSRLDGRYGDEAIALLISEMRACGTEPHRYEVKVFGGGNMFPRHYGDKRDLVGDRNIEFALERLGAAGMKVFASHVAGEGHREVIFEVWSGDVWVRHSPAPAAEDGK